MKEDNIMKVIAIDGVSSVGKTTFLNYVRTKGYTVIRPADFYKERKDGLTIELWRCVWVETLLKLTTIEEDIVFLDRSPASFEVYQQVPLDWFYTLLPYWKDRFEFYGILFECSLEQLKANRRIKAKVSLCEKDGSSTCSAIRRFRKAKVWGNGWQHTFNPLTWREVKGRLLTRILQECK